MARSTHEPAIAATVLDRVSEEGYAVHDGLFYASNGLVLQLRRVSRFVLVDAARKMKPPPVPSVYLADKEREEENPEDPTYLQEMQDFEYERGMLTITTMLALGCEVHTMPEGMVPPDDDDWFAVLEALQITVIPNNKRLRFAAWLKYVGLDDILLMKLITEIQRYSGLTLEADVGEAEKSFPGDATRNGTAKDTVAPASQRGNSPVRRIGNGPRT